MPRISSRSFARFNGLLASAVERGVELAPALELLAAQETRAPLRAALEEAVRAVREGAPLHAALSRSPETFPPEYCALVQAGLEGGRLAEALRASQTYHELRARLARNLTGLSLYLAAGALLVGGVLATLLRVLLEMREVYDIIKVDLPRVTALMLWCAEHMGAFCLIAAALVGIGAGAIILLRRRGLLGRSIYLLPIWGPIRRTRDLALVATTLSIRLQGGSPVPEALRSAAGVVRNPHARRAIDTAARAVEEGKGLSEALYYQPFFPRTLAWAVSLGEERGDVASVFDDFARVYAGDLERRFTVLFQIFSPLGLLLIGNMALLSAVALLLPVVNLFEAIGGGRR